MRLVKRFLDTSGITSLLLRIRAGNPLILAYHNVVSVAVDCHRDLGSAHTHLRDFVHQVLWLRDRFEFVPLDEIVLGRKKHARNLACITFDDAYLGAVANAIPLLVKLGIPTTLFVAPALLGRQAFWWDLVNDDPWASFDHYFVQRLGIQGRVLEGCERLRPAPVPEECLSATESEVMALAMESGGLVRIGSHSWGHENLASLSHEERLASLRRARSWVVDRYAGAATQVLAYPYGLASPDCERDALSCGHSAAVIIDGGRWHFGGNPYRVTRTNVPASAVDASFRLLCAR